MGCDDHTHIHFNRAITTNPLNLFLFQNPQQFGLHDGGHVPDLIQKKGAATGLFELAQMPRCGTCERSFLMSEQL